MAESKTTEASPETYSGIRLPMPEDEECANLAEVDLAEQYREGFPCASTV